MATCDLEMLKDIPGYKIVLKAVLKGQIQQLVQQLADQTDEESVILTASVSDGTLSHLGSESGKGFLEDHEDIKTQFLGFCLKNRHKQWLEKNNHGGTTSVQTSSKEPDLPHLSLKQGVMLSRSSPRLRHAPYIVKRATSNKALNVKNNNSLNETSTVSKTPVTESPKAVSDNSIKFKVEILENKEESTNVGEIGKLGADQDVKTVKQSVAKREAFENRPQSQNEATFQNEAEKTWLDSDYESLPVSENSNKVIPEGLFVNSGFANLMGADKSDSENKTESDIDTYVTVKVEAISDSDTELEETSQSWVNPEHSMDMSFNPDTDALDSHDDTSMQHSQIPLSQDGSLVSRPKAGLVLPEVATEFGMIEIYPQSGVYWYRGQKEAVLFNCQQPETVMSRIIDVFFDKNIQKLSSARGIGKFKPLCPVIIDACLRFVQRLYEVDQAALIKVINNKCCHSRRPRRVGCYSREKYLENKRKKRDEKEMGNRNRNLSVPRTKFY
ncbi:uncharacterized protein LOC123541472 isoform X3 [Mercenaria mercenaria]|uniref:uncharacterized protein LOC123541472 isoform X3 n=1 Tax=Mercenaria mercenaria TaxID=6596 RepID=UPI00234F0C7E|nr:uncharacterized protein LOC123541472 isoform X3 [Mercenaria mercenaria]